MNGNEWIGAKPAEGVSGSPLQDFGKLYTYDSTGRIKSTTGTSGPLTDKTYGASLTNPSARIGDYVIQNGKPVAVPNSPTDLAQRYKIAIGGTESPSYNASLKVEGGGAVKGAALGATTGFMVGGPLGAGFGALIGAFGGSLSAHDAAAEEALKNWQNENVKYDSAVDFYRDENGVLKYKLDYQKMGTGGPRSGSSIKEAQNRETSVSLGDDGHLKVTVSPIFASTSRFDEIIKWISENYAGLTKDTENYEQILEEIKNGINGEVQSYVTNMKLYADYANRFPEASSESIIGAYMTEAAGYADPEKMDSYEMFVIGDNGVEVKTAKEFFDSVYNMNKDDRNRLLGKLYDIIYDENDEYTDGERAIAYGEKNALYAVSKNSEEYENDKYQGMLDQDAFVSFMNNFNDLGLNVGDVLKFVSGGNVMATKQEFLNENDLAAFLGIATSAAASVATFVGATSLIEKGLKLLPGTSRLFEASLEGQAGGGLATLLQETEALGGPSAANAVAKAASATAAFKTLKIGIFDAALAGAKTLVSGTDFWPEFGQDFVRDAILEMIFSYYDMVKFESAVNDSTVLVLRDPKTGNISRVPTTDIDTIADEGLEPVGAYNVQKTSSGKMAGVYRFEDKVVYYYDGKVAVGVNSSGEAQRLLAGPDGVTDGIPNLKTGVSNADATVASQMAEVESSIESLNLPKDYGLSSLPAQSAAAAQMAAKFAKMDASKAGLAINKALFNKNAVLDTVNEIALSKTGDLTAWQNRSQKFVSVTDNANQEKNLIKTGAYSNVAKEAFDEYQMTLGALNLTQRYSKADANFLKATVQLERAAYLDRHKVEGDTRDYTAEALEKYGEAIAKIPDDRAEVLRDFLQKRKNRADAIKLSAKKSGKIDVKKLDSFMDSDMQKEIGWVPQWGKRQTYRGLLDRFYGVSQERNIYKTWLPEGGWVDLDKLEDPLVADSRFFDFVTTNMGINDMKESSASAFEDAGLLVDNTPTSASIQAKKLASIKNKDELKKKMEDMVEAKRKEVEEKVPSQKQYKEMMEKVIEDSKMLKSIEKVITAKPSEDGMRMGAIIKSTESLLNKAVEYNNLFGYNFDAESYMNTSFLPNLKEALNKKDMSLASAIVNQAVLDIAPYRSRAEVLKSQQDIVAQEWREWAEKHIKAGRTDNKELKKFADDNNLELPKDNRPLSGKVKHALWGMVQSGKKLPKVVGLESNKVSKDMDKEDFYKMLDGTPLFQSVTKNKKELVDLVAAEINGETIDAYEMGTATTALGLGGRYPISWYRNGKPYTRFLTYRNAEEQRLAEETVQLFTDKQLIKQPGVVSRIAAIAANDFRQLTTALDPTRSPLNFARDTGRGFITSGGQSFINPSKIFKSLVEFGDYSVAEKEKLSKALDNVAEMVAGETYNAAYRSPGKTTVQATKEYLSRNGANPLRRFTYNVVHDKRGLLEKPADFFEGLTRKRLAKSAAVVKLRQLQKEGASFEEQLKGMTDAAFFAGREYTANFQRKGAIIGATSKYVAYQSSAYAGLNGMKMAFINNPQGVSKNFAVFLLLYLILLADTLGDEKSRKNYYRLSEYDRGNSLVISLDDDTVLTIPLDQEVAGFLFPYRRFMETLNGVDPVSFYELVWGTLTEPLPMDLSGFTEGEGFNLVRGLEKLTAQNMPNIITPIQEAATGYDLYYGTDLRVTDETLKDYGIYNPDAGDYTTAGRNSALLRQVANATGIPQWQLQTMVEGYGGNVGSYVLNILDKFGGATEEAQGGKDFINAIFKSFVATDQDAAASAFYDGIKQLQQEKRKVVQAVANYNEDLKTATGSAKVELQTKLQKVKDDYAVKVGDFVDKYISAYEITGGLSKSQAMQVYYLFRFDDDDTVYEAGSVEEYYNNKALQKFKNQATAMSAPILDRYYNNRIGNIYRNADGEWVRYLSSGTQAMRNSIYGQSEEHMVNLLNILEGKNSNLNSLRKQVKAAREQAYNAKNYDERDRLGYNFDLKVVEAISPYIEQYGAENVLGTNEVLDYLSDWFFVPDDFKRTKKGGHVSLGNSASAEEAFVRPYIKYLFGLPTNYYSYSDTALTSPSLGDIGR